MLSAAAIIVAIVIPSHTGPYSLRTMAKLETHAMAGSQPFLSLQPHEAVISHGVLGGPYLLLPSTL